MKNTNNHLEIKYYGTGKLTLRVPNLLVKESFQQYNLSIFKEKQKQRDSDQHTLEDLSLLNGLLYYAAC